MSSLKLGIFGDAGNSLTNGTAFYYSPGAYARYSIGASAPLQDAVATMMRGWGVSELIQLGDSAYNVNASTLLDYNIGQYYNDYMAPYGGDADFAFSDPDSIYAQSDLGGVQAVFGGKQWPYNLYDFPYGFPHPVSGGAGGSADGLNHYWLVPGNHDAATVIGSYSDTNVNQVDFQRNYVGPPLGPDAFDYRNNIATDPPPPANPDNFRNNQAIRKVGSQQQVLDYHPYLQVSSDISETPDYLTPGQVRIGQADPNGYGIYYSVDYGEQIIDGVARPLLHVVMLDSSRVMTDAGYYNFNFADRREIANQPGSGLVRNNYQFDPTDPAAKAFFQPEDAEGPSISYEMFSWIKQDLEQSDAVWNVVTSHHPGYHVGNTTNSYNDGYFNNPVIVNFLKGLKNDAGQPLFDAFFNGHSHAYSRTLEMAYSDDGIGPGIPFVTTGNGGKVLDPLNEAPYGTSVLTPQNWLVPANAAQLNSDYLAELPSDALPTSVGLSGYFRYSSDTLPPGHAAGKDPAEVTLKVSPEFVNPSAASSTFKLYDSAYNSILKATPEELSDVSGLYGYGSGAAYVEVDAEYFFLNYQTAHPLDPAVVLIGSEAGLSDNAMQRGSLFYERWSPATAQLADLALFSFDVVVDAQEPSGYLDHLQIVQQGNGYQEVRIGRDIYLDGTYTFEIFGNNPPEPLAWDQSDPTRAAVDLTFVDGRLQAVAFAKDANGELRQGSGYLQLANAINENNFNASSTESLLVGVNINLEAQSNLADQAPGDELYQDWYLTTATAIGADAQAGGHFGALALDLAPSSRRAREIIATQPLTTGYSGYGQQSAPAHPRQASLSISDANGTVLASTSQAPLRRGEVSLAFARQPAPGPIEIEFEGDPLSSYLVNYLPAAETQNLTYGAWDAGLSFVGPRTWSVSAPVELSVVRTDAQDAVVSLGLRRAGQPRFEPLMLLPDAQPSSTQALDTSMIFTPSGPGSWLASQGQPSGSFTPTAVAVPRGQWSPVALNAQGEPLAITAMEVSANVVDVAFEGGVSALYSLPGSGEASLISPSDRLVLTLKSLSRAEQGLALYPADLVTGAVTTPQGTWLPQDDGYLQAALRAARRAGLVLGPDQLPAYQGETVLTDLPLRSDQNYGVLLMPANNPDDLWSSYSQANPGDLVTMISFSAPGRGVAFGLDTTPSPSGQMAFNELILGLSTAEFTLL